MYKISVSHANNNNVIMYIIQELYMCDGLSWTTNLTGLSSCVYTGVYICLYTHVCVRLRMITHGGMLVCGHPIVVTFTRISGGHYLE